MNTSSATDQRFAMDGEQAHTTEVAPLLSKAKGAEKSCDESSMWAIHCVETELHSQLSRHPELEFERLSVRRTPQGICLDGIVLFPETPEELNAALSEVVDLDTVINRLEVRGSMTSSGRFRVPPKG